MANRIKGLTVEIDGSTTGLDKALKDVNSTIRNTQTQLKDVQRLLKLDPSNTELLSQKQRLLKDAIGETKEKLETLKTAQEQAKKQLEEGTLGQDKYDALQREIEETEQSLKNLESQVSTTYAALEKIDETRKKFQQVGDKMAGVGKTMTTHVTAPIIGIGAAAIKTTADFDAQMSKVSAISGATGKDFDDLRAKAREMGAKTKFSASEAGEAFEYMAMAGWKTGDMIVGTELKQVTIENGVVVECVDLAQLNADNTLKGGINVQKVIKDTDGTVINNTDDKFTVTLTMKNKDDTAFTDFDYRIFYGENNPKYANTTDYPDHHTGHVFGTTAAKPVDNQDDVVDTKEPPQGKCYIAGNTDGKVTFELYVGDTLRVINIPAGVTYSVVEDQSKLPKLPDATSSLYEFVEVKYEIKVGDGDYTSDSPNSSGTYTVKGNSASRATVVNTIPSVPMQIIKIGQSNRDKPLANVWFKLYYDAAGERQILKDSIGFTLGETVTYEDETTDEGVLVTDAEGKVSLGRLIAGDYYLKEIKTNDGYVLLADMIPITITKVNNEMHVSYNQAGNSLSQSGAGVIKIPNGGGFAIVINNDSGVELPHTGGPGTTLIYLLGILLTGIAGAALVIRKRRENA